MLHTYLTHMKEMIVIAEEAAKVLDPDYNKERISPRVAKIINSINKSRPSRKLKILFFVKK